MLGSPKTGSIEIINNKARHNLIDVKCRWRSDRLEFLGTAWSNKSDAKPPGAITHEVCCLAAQLEGILNIHQSWMIPFIFYGAG